MNLIPYSRYARTVLNCEKTPFLHEFLDEPDTSLTFEWPPGRMSPAYTVVWGWSYAHVSEKQHGAQDYVPKDHECNLFVFISACVIAKDPNTPNWSSMADDAITQGGFGISSLNLLPLPLPVQEWVRQVLTHFVEQVTLKSIH